ncbi:MAG: hypothetical protein H6R18_673 [Proteobacteria bacterium]|nr:hypothetical protein [Pseudomonadota bacterium]
MSNPVAPPSPEINHLRAAVALIPVIESGLADSKLTPERASLMAAFCEWTTESAFDKPEAVKFATRVKDGLEQLKVALSVSATDSEQT